MSNATLSKTRPRLHRLRLPRIDYGPFLILPAVPWLLLATVLRAKARMAHDPSAFLLLIICEFALFLAFLIASQTMIRSAGGVTSLGRLPFLDQVRFAWSIIWRLLLFFLVCNLAALQLGMDKFSAVGAWFGFDGIVFPWQMRLLPIWSAVVATLVFLAVVERGMDRKATARAVVTQLFVRIRNLGPAIVYAALFLLFVQTIQFAVADVIRPLLGSLSSNLVTNLLSVGFLLLFSYVRLIGTLVILTLAVKASYRRESATDK